MSLLPSYFIYNAKPLVLVDVGAAGGIRPNWKAALPVLKVIGFEPDKRSLEKLSQEGDLGPAEFLGTGLYKERETVGFYLTKAKTKSSLLEPNRKLLDRFPNSSRFDLVGEEKIEVDSLDNQLRERGIGDVDFIKLDIQGAELYVLEGARQILQKSVIGVEIEVEFVRLYKDQPLFADIDSFLRGYGFELFDLDPHYWKREIGREYGGPKGQIVYGDALYFSGLERMSRILGGLGDEAAKKSKLLRAILVCLIYGYIDYALELAESFNSLFNGGEYEVLVGSVKKFDLSKPGILKFLASILRPQKPIWNFTRKDLGNL